MKFRRIKQELAYQILELKIKYSIFRIEAKIYLHDLFKG